MSIPFQVALQDREVIGSGSVIVHRNEGLMFHVADFMITVSFAETEDQKSDTAVSLKSEEELSLSFINFSNPIGTSCAGEMGIVNGRKLWGSFFVSTVGENNEETRLVNYAFSLGEPAMANRPQVKSIKRSRRSSRY